MKHEEKNEQNFTNITIVDKASQGSADSYSGLDFYRRNTSQSQDKSCRSSGQTVRRRSSPRVLHLSEERDTDAYIQSQERKHQSNLVASQPSTKFQITEHGVMQLSPSERNKENIPRD